MPLLYHDASEDRRTLRRVEAQKRRIAEQRREEESRLVVEAEQNIHDLVEATDQLIAETDECDCVEAWASDIEPRQCAKHAAIEALRPFKKERK